MPGRIVVTGRVPEPALELLREAGEVDAHMQETALSVEELHAAVAGADAVLTLLSDRVDDAFLEAAGPQLRVVSNVAVGYNNIDVAACSARGVLVTNTPGVLTDATADIAMALILMVMRRLGEGERVIRSQTGWRWHMHYMLGTSLQGKALGIVGMGRIGQALRRHLPPGPGPPVARTLCPVAQTPLSMLRRLVLAHGCFHLRPLASALANSHARRPTMALPLQNGRAGDMK